MKTVIKNLAILTTLFMCIPANGQGELNSLVEEYRSAMRRNSTGFTDIEGSPYYNDKFEDALVFRKGSSGPLSSKMRYNNCFDEMEFLSGHGDEYLLLTDKERVDSILLNDKVYQYRGYMKGKEELYGFFIRLTDTNPTLFIKRSKRYQERKAPESGYEDYMPAAFVNEKDAFYIGVNDQPLLLITSRKNKIAPFFKELGFENKSDIKIKYDESVLIQYVKGLKKTP